MPCAPVGGRLHCENYCVSRAMDELTCLHISKSGSAAPPIVMKPETYEKRGARQGEFQQNRATGTSSNGGPVFHFGTPGQGFNPTNSGYVAPAAGSGAGAKLVFNTIFQSLSYLGPVDGGASTSQSLSVGIALNGGVAALSTTPGVSLLGTLYVDTIGVAPGTDWALSIGQHYNDPSSPGFGVIPFNGPLDFGDPGSATPFNTVLIDGIIHINVPEPESIVLFAAASPMFVVRGVACRRSKD